MVVVWCASGRRPVVVCVLHPVRWCVVVVWFGVVRSIRRAPDPVPVRLDAARRARSGALYARAYLYRGTGLGTFFLNFPAFCLVRGTFALYLLQLNKQTHTQNAVFFLYPRARFGFDLWRRFRPRLFRRRCDSNQIDKIIMGLFLYAAALVCAFFLCLDPFAGHID